MRQPVVYLVDDEENNLLLFKRSLKPFDYQLETFRDGREVLDALAAGGLPDLILSDVMMPRVNGYEVCELVKKDPRTAMVPIVLVTGLHEIKDKIRGLEAGADDFLHKPFHPLELRARVKSLLRIKSLHDQLDAKNRLLGNEKVLLEELVRERTHELEDLTVGLTAALEKANRLNDEDTGNHIKRVCLYSEMLAQGLGLDPSMCQSIGRYASLHDVGKVGIPDGILKKPGKLTPEEWTEMQRHTVYGYELLRVAGADVIAQNIALCHHEKYDGTGYPYGLKDIQIPIEARIVTCADVYDALLSKRVYKPAFSQEKAESIIRSGSGRHFDPDVVAVLFDNREQCESIRQAYVDTDEEQPIVEEITMERPPRHLAEHLKMLEQAS
ncbi:MAG: putative two-component system response regulator [Myxococcota bacterium]|jgi:putative two-component system response regulator